MDWRWKKYTTHIPHHRTIRTVTSTQTRQPSRYKSKWAIKSGRLCKTHSNHYLHPLTLKSQPKLNCRAKIRIRLPKKYSTIYRASGNAHTTTQCTCIGSCKRRTRHSVKWYRKYWITYGKLKRRSCCNFCNFCTTGITSMLRYRNCTKSEYKSSIYRWASCSLSWRNLTTR